MRGPSGRGASRLAHAGVLESTSTWQASVAKEKRSHGGRIACGGRRVVRNASWQRLLRRIESQCEQIAAVGGALNHFFSQGVD